MPGMFSVIFFLHTSWIRSQEGLAAPGIVSPVLNHPKPHDDGWSTLYIDMVINEQETVNFIVMNVFKHHFPSRKAKSFNQHFTHSIDLVENLPLLVRDPQGLGCLDRPFQLARPHLQINNFLLFDELLQCLSKLEKVRGG